MRMHVGRLNQDQTLPLLIEPPVTDISLEDFLASLVEQREWIWSQCRIWGGVLWRGFPGRGSDGFQQIARALTEGLRAYVEGQSPRTKVSKDVYTSTEYPARFRISLHQELSYAKHPPAVIVFGCETAAETGGETPIADARQVFQKLDPDVRRRFQERGVLYVKQMHAETSGMGKSWMDHFESSNRNDVEAYLRANDVEFRWLPHGGLRTESRRPAVIQHPATREWIWFNQANLWHVSNLEPAHRDQMLRTFGVENLPTHAFYGDGSPIPDEDIAVVNRTLWEQAMIFPWKEGDVLLLDNYLVAHGRNAYTGPRRILVAMGDA